MISSLKLSTKISAIVSLFVVVAMLASAALFAVQGYINFHKNIRKEAENSLGIFQAMHTQAMLNRQADLEGEDPVITSFDGALKQLSENIDRFSLWMVMGPKVIAFQKRTGHESIEAPLDDIDREAIETGKIVSRMAASDIFRLSVPAILGEGDAAAAKCIACHGTLMGLERGEVVGVYSIGLSAAELWAEYIATTRIAILGAIGVSILISLMSIILLKGMVISPISRMTQSMRKLVDGLAEVEITDINRRDEIGEMAMALEVFRDNALELNFQKFALDEHAIVSITDVRGNITYVNDKFCEISGFPREELIGENHRMIKSDEHSASFYKSLWGTVSNGVTWQGNVKNLKKNGEEYWVKATVVPFKNEQGKPFRYVSIRTDITEQRRAEQLKVMAHHDALTGLPNRNLLDDRLLLAIAQAKRLDAEIAFMYLDLDKFKPINDALGHDVGDEVLQEVARRLTSIVRETDTVARVGGDEFVIILAAPVPRGVSERTAKNILEVLAPPIRAKGHDCVVGASIGISTYPTDTDDAEQLIKLADMAMYRVKKSGRNGYCYHGSDPV